MKYLIAFASVSAAALAATPAAAQQATTAPQGGRIEALIGYDRVKVDLRDLGVNDSFKDEGVAYGLGAGYDVAVGNTTAVGIDLEATESTMKEGDSLAEVKAGRDLYAGGRLSFAIAPNSNVYVKGGYTNFRVKGEAGTLSESDNLDGYRLGAGAQFGIGGKAYVGGEYRYSNYEQDVSRHQLMATVGARF